MIPLLISSVSAESVLLMRTVAVRRAPSLTGLGERPCRLTLRAALHSWAEA